VRNQLLVDISELVQPETQADAFAAEQGILKEWLLNCPQGYRVEPVYATADNGYRYARRFTAALLDSAVDGLQDEPIDYAPGDVFFAFAPQPAVQTKQDTFYQHFRNQGGRVCLAARDLSADGRHADAEATPQVTVKQSAAQLLAIVLNDNPSPRIDQDK